MCVAYFFVFVFTEIKARTAPPKQDFIHLHHEIGIIVDLLCANIDVTTSSSKKIFTSEDLKN